MPSLHSPDRLVVAFDDEHAVPMLVGCCPHHWPSGWGSRRWSTDWSTSVIGPARTGLAVLAALAHNLLRWTYALGFNLPGLLVAKTI